MAHKEQQQFFLRIKRKYPHYFKNVNVLKYELELNYFELENGDILDGDMEVIWNY